MTEQPRVNPTYRLDIDGLRAVAIVPVIAFHIWPAVVPNGYLGVDVFFVISGFLIYTILLRDFQAATFSFGRFWMRRLKRLYPAIGVLSVSCLVMGYFILQREEWQSLAEQTVAAFTCSANIYMWQHANNYWGESSATMPFLHMWSLAVEEQFYIVFPMALYFFFRSYHRANRLKVLLLIHCLMFAASFAMWVYGTQNHRSAGFYLLPFRAWEILAGCCVAIFVQIRPIRELGNWTSRWLPDAGLCIILATFVTATKHGHQSPVLAALCCLGSTLNLLRNTRVPVTPITKLLMSQPAVFVGRISYSLYLWHWPLIVLGYKVIDPTGIQLLVLSFAAGAISYRVVELTTRTGSDNRFKVVVTSLTLLLIIAIAMPYYISRPEVTYAVPALMRDIGLTPDNQAKLGKYTGNYTTGLVLADLATTSQIDVLILGDSHAIMYFPAIRTACDEINASLAFYGAGALTSPFFVANGHAPSEYSISSWTDEQRLDFDRYRKDFIRAHKPRLIIVCAKWTAYGAGEPLRDLNSHLEQLTQISPDSRFLFAFQPPELPLGAEVFSTGTMDLPSLRKFTEAPATKRMRRAAHSVIRAFVESHSNCILRETEQLFMQGNTVRFMDGQTMLYWDDDHLSVDGAMLCKSLFEDAIRNTLRNESMAIIRAGDKEK